MKVFMSVVLFACGHDTQFHSHATPLTSTHSHINTRKHHDIYRHYRHYHHDSMRYIQRVQHMSTYQNCGSLQLRVVR